MSTQSDPTWSTFRRVMREAATDAIDGGTEIAKGEELEDFLDLAADHLSAAFRLEGNTVKPRFFYRRWLRKDGGAV